MGSSAGLLLIGLLVAFYEVPSLLKKNQRKEVIVFSGLLFISILFGILISLDVDIPTPLKLITIIFKPASDFIQFLLS